MAISFSSAGSTDSDGSIVTYAWTFGDGGTSSAANPTHTYANPGTYTVMLTVTDNRGGTDSDQTTATIANVNDAPVANANGAYTGTENVAVSFSSAGSTDPDGTIAGYFWTFGDGATSTSANPTHTYTTAGTYNVQLTVTDNNGATDNDATTAVIAPESTGGEDLVLVSTDFEAGIGIWIDGGTDALLYTGGTYAYSGSKALDIQDNSGTKSSYYTNQDFNVSGYSAIDVEFYFYAVGMESAEDFWVQYYNGSAWQTVASYKSGTNFNNNTFYVANVTISSADYNFPTNAEFRFQCDASNNADDVYIDDVTITATNSKTATEATITKVKTGSKTFAIEETEFSVYPNPAIDELHINFASDENTVINIYSLNGQLVKSVEITNDNHTVNVSELTTGLYLIRAYSDGEVYTQKFMKK